MSVGSDIQSAQWQSWQEACQRLNVSVSEEQQSVLARFYTLLIEANRTTNLTRLTAPDDFLYRHLLDSLSITPLIPEGARLADIGSGAGFPAIPLAIMRPDIQVTAVESVGKKCQFIDSIREQLNLSNLSVRNERSETLGQDPAHRAQYDVVTARAVSALPVLLELCMPLLKTGGLFLAMKGESYEPELAAASKALKTLGGQLERIEQYADPHLAGSRVLIIQKTKPTPPAYPRQPGLPAKNPL